jgi:hypothetical protein
VSLTLEQEREMLAQLRDDLKLVAPETHEEILKTRNGVAWFDQYKTATAETKKTEPFFKPKGRVMVKSREFSAMNLAGVLRCFAAAPCKHASKGDRPLFAFLAARVISCRQCILTFHAELRAQDARVRDGADTVCDYCLREASDFYETQIAFGPTTLIGDMCDACWNLAAQKAAS